MTPAPIALFAYNRPTHLARTLEALRDNPLAHESRLHIYSDGPKTSRDEPAVAQVRHMIRKTDGFAEVTIHEQTANIGLARSIIAGVTELSERYGSVIVLEDDLLVAPGFLTFMNQALVPHGLWRYQGTSSPLSTLNIWPQHSFFLFRLVGDGALGIAHGNSSSMTQLNS
jgi:GT2 family glycosyltransferase